MYDFSLKKLELNWEETWSDFKKEKMTKKYRYTVPELVLTRDERAKARMDRLWPAESF